MKIKTGKVLEITNLYTGEEFKVLHDSRAQARREGSRAIARMRQGVFTISDFSTGAVLDYGDTDSNPTHLAEYYALVGE